MVPLCSAGRTATRGRKPPQFCQPQHDHHCKGSNKSARAATIFIDNGALQALVGCHELDDGGFGVVRHDEFRNPVLRRPARGRAGLAFMLFCAAREGAMAGTRKIAAILVADVVGYSRLAGADEDRTLARLRGLRSDLIDPAIDAHHGRIVKRTGDGILVEFRSVVDAVRCAIEVQQRPDRAQRRPAAGAPHRVPRRHSPRRRRRGGRRRPDGRRRQYRRAIGGNRQAGRESVCPRTPTRQVKGRLDLAVADLGPTQLKNIAEPVRVYSLEVGKPALAKRAEPKRRTTLAPLGLGVAALVILVAASAWYFSGANRLPNVASTAAAPAAHLSIVVLPFKNLSGDPSQDYFADGVTDNLTTELSRIRNSFVIAARHGLAPTRARASTSRQIGKDLGVRYVLEGSVQREQNHVRVNAQLVDAESGAQLWADRFEEDVADLFKLQDEVVARLGNTLGNELFKAEVKKGHGSKNPADTIEPLAKRLTNSV